MADAFEPKTAQGKQAIAEGADPDVVKSMEEDGTYVDTPDNKENLEGAEHVEIAPKPGEEGGGQGGANPKPKPGEGEGGGEGDVTPPAPNRRVEHVPAWRAREDAKKAREEGIAEGRRLAEANLAVRLEEAGKKEGGANQEDVNKIAEEFGLKPEVVPAFIERIGGIVAKSVKVEGLTPEDRATLDAAKEAERQQKEVQGFEQEWSNEATLKALQEAAGGREITQQVKDAVKRIAYTEGYTNYRLADIVRLNATDLFPKGSKTAEVGRGGAGRGPAAKSIDEMTPADIENLSDEDFDALSNELGKRGSRFIRTSVPPKGKK